MTVSTKPTEKEKPRVRLGEQATLAAEAFAPEGEQINAAHLEQAVIQLKQDNADLSEQNDKLRNGPDGVTRTVLQKEFDQIHHELTTQLQANQTEMVNMFNAMRHLIELVASDIAEEDTEAAVKEVNAWLDRAIKPIAASREEASKKRIGDGRIPEEEDVTQATTQHSEVGQVMRDQEPELFQDRDMGMER